MRDAGQHSSLHLLCSAFAVDVDLPLYAHTGLLVAVLSFASVLRRRLPTDLARRPRPALRAALRASLLQPCMPSPVSAPDAGAALPAGVSSVAAAIVAAAVITLAAGALTMVATTMLLPRPPVLPTASSSQRTPAAVLGPPPPDNRPMVIYPVDVPTASPLDVQPPRVLCLAYALFDYLHDRDAGGLAVSLCAGFLQPDECAATSQLAHFIFSLPTRPTHIHWVDCRHGMDRPSSSC